MTTTIFSHAVRLIVCANCGAPMEVDLGGGQASCRYCGTQNVLSRRDESQDIAQAERMRASQMTEAERLEVLRSQDNRPMPVPPSVERYLAGGRLLPEHAEAAQAEWRWTCKQVQQGAALVDQDRLFHLTLVIAKVVDDRHERALLENALEVLPDARHRQILRSLLAHHAVVAGDLAAARDWLKPCNPRPTDIRMDTAYRLAASYLATAENDPAKVSRILGHRPGDVPIADGQDEEAEILRANAIERQGNAPMATDQLRHLMRTDLRRIAAMRDVIYDAERLKLCEQSFAAAFQAVWQEADQTMRPQSLTSLGCIGFGCLIPIGGMAIVMSALLGLFGTESALVVNAVVHPLIWLVLVPGGIIFASLRARATKKRLRDGGRLTFGRVVSCQQRLSHGKNSTTVFQELTVDVELDGKLYRTQQSVVRDQPVGLGAYPCLLDPDDMKNMVLRVTPLTEVAS